MKRWLIIALTVGVLLTSAYGCGTDGHSSERDGYQPIHLETDSASNLSLDEVWKEVAKQGAFDPETASLEWLWLEYSGSGLLVQGSIRAISADSRLVQIGFSPLDLTGTSRLSVGGGIAPIDTSYSKPVRIIREVLRAVDLVGSARMIALIGSSGPDGRYAISPAPMPGDGSQSIPRTATAYCWDGSTMLSIAPDDARRDYGDEYVYVAGYAAVSVSSGVTNGNTRVTAYESSGQGVFFLIPRQLL